MLQGEVFQTPFHLLQVSVEALAASGHIPFGPVFMVVASGKLQNAPGFCRIPPHQLAAVVDSKVFAAVFLGRGIGIGFLGRFIHARRLVIERQTDTIQNSGLSASGVSADEEYRFAVQRSLIKADFCLLDGRDIF